MQYSQVLAALNVYDLYLCIFFVLTLMCPRFGGRLLPDDDDMTSK